MKQNLLPHMLPASRCYLATKPKAIGLPDHGRKSTKLWAKTDTVFSWDCWDIPVIPAPGRLRQENHEFQASLDYIMSLRPACDTKWWDPHLPSYPPKRTSLFLRWFVSVICYSNKQLTSTGLYGNFIFKVLRNCLNIFHCASLFSFLPAVFEGSSFFIFSPTLWFWYAFP
jgi:hypothetical protein